MASKRAPQNFPKKITPETAERIVRIALQHPELGARRLVPLLKKQRISVSATSIQNILRRHNLQTRDRRLAKAKPEKKPPKTRKPKSQPKKPSSPISEKVAARIVDVIAARDKDFRVVVKKRKHPGPGVDGLFDIEAPWAAKPQPPAGRGEQTIQKDAETESAAQKVPHQNHRANCRTHL